MTEAEMDETMGKILRRIALMESELEDIAFAEDQLQTARERIETLISKAEEELEEWKEKVTDGKA